MTAVADTAAVPIAPVPAGPSAPTDAHKDETKPKSDDGTNPFAALLAAVVATVAPVVTPPAPSVPSPGGGAAVTDGPVATAGMARHQVPAPVTGPAALAATVVPSPPTTPGADPAVPGAPADPGDPATAPVTPPNAAPTPRPMIAEPLRPGPPTATAPAPVPDDAVPERTAPKAEDAAPASTPTGPPLPTPPSTAAPAMTNVVLTTPPRAVPAAAPPSPPPATVAPAPAHVQVVSHVTPVLQRGDGSYHLSVQLHPAELGGVRLDVRLHDGQVSLQLRADTQAGHAALRDNLPQLRHELEAAGVSAGALDLGDWTGGQQPPPDASRRQSAPTFTTEPQPPASAEGPAVVTDDSAIDVRM